MALLFHGEHRRVDKANPELQVFNSKAREKILNNAQKCLFASSFYYLNCLQNDISHCKAFLTVIQNHSLQLVNESERNGNLTSLYTFDV